MQVLKDFFCTNDLVATFWNLQVLLQVMSIVPIPGTTKLALVQENLMTANPQFTPMELQDLKSTISKITIREIDIL